MKGCGSAFFLQSVPFSSVVQRFARSCFFLTCRDTLSSLPFVYLPRVQIVQFVRPYGRRITIRIPQSVSPAVAFFGLNRDLTLDQAIDSLKNAYPVLADGSDASNAKVANLRKHHERYYRQHISQKGGPQSTLRASVVKYENRADCAEPSASSSSSSAGAPLSGAAFTRAVIEKAAEFHKREQLVSDMHCGFHAYVFVLKSHSKLMEFIE
jgi:hypothetical protein